MLNVKELKELLLQNEKLTILAMRDESHNGTQRLHELLLHRTIVKDLIIEQLELEIKRLSQNEAA